MTIFLFDELIEKHGYKPKEARLLRHDSRAVAAWHRGRHNAFGCFASFQKNTPSPYRGVELAFHFLPGLTLPCGDVTAIFVGATRILASWEWDGLRLPIMQDKIVIDSEQGVENLSAYDLEWIEELQEFSERVLVRWGKPSSARAWSQWANENKKEILELRLEAVEEPFPGFSSFVASTSEVPHLPQAWQAALASVRGVYLLVAPNGAQYVGSATGSSGFIGRWSNYAANGHGGNVLFREHGHLDYNVSILEIASPDTASDEVLQREKFWKLKLGTKAHGLNMN